MEQEKVIACYNQTADAYAALLYDELAKKPLDRLLLKQFASENKSKGKMIDLGCGPGQITRFLADSGISEIVGTDISPGMVEKAKALNQEIPFQVADMLKLDFPDQCFGSAVAFYAIVHFDIDQLKKALLEVSRVIVSGGQFLIAFHIGDEAIHLNEFFGAFVDVDFSFFKTEAVLSLLKASNFKVIDAIERYPYEGAEHQSKRAYLLAEKL